MSSIQAATHPPGNLPRSNQSLWDAFETAFRVEFAHLNAPTHAMRRQMASRPRPRPPQLSPDPSPASTPPPPRDSRLERRELRQQLLRENRCFYCHEVGHRRARCWARPSNINNRIADPHRRDTRRRQREAARLDEI